MIFPVPRRLSATVTEHELSGPVLAGRYKTPRVFWAVVMIRDLGKPETVRRGSVHAACNDLGRSR